MLSETSSARKGNETSNLEFFLKAKTSVSQNRKFRNATFQKPFSPTRKIIVDKVRGFVIRFLYGQVHKP